MKLIKLGDALLSLAACISLTFLLSGCLVPDSGTESGTLIDMQPIPPPQDPNTYVCNPMDGGSQNQARTQGIKGTLYYLDDTQPRYNDVESYILNGHMVQAPDVGGVLHDLVLYFNQIFIPTRPFDRGFTTQSGDTIVTQDGNTLYEWFAVRHEGRIQLGSKPAGSYQLAILSDDGALLSMDFGSGMQSVINNDTNHPTKMGCATVPVDFTATDKIPFILDYNQGPRYHISLILMWRPMPAGNTLDAFCGQQGNSFYFDSTQNPPAPTANYNAMLARGWEPLAAENYLLPAETKENPCNAPAPVISNFRVLSIGMTSVTLAWTTDIQSTSQIIYRKIGVIAESSTPTDGLFYTDHTVTVTGLTSNTDYSVRASSASTSGLTTESAPLTIRTRR
jgi:hypothetical protein